MKRQRPHLLAILFLAVSPLPAQVYTPTVLRQGQPDTTSLTALAQSIYANAGAATPYEKAKAIWRFFLTDGRFVEPGFWYHIAGWAYEEPQGEVLDAVKLLNSYGFGLCYHIAPLLEAVFEAGGFEDARVWFLTGHTVAEVFYDGSYHHFDSDMMGYTCPAACDDQGRQVASVHQIEKHGGIMLGKLLSPTKADRRLVDHPWYPADLREAAMEGLAELFTTSSDNWVFPETRYSRGHSMDFVLRPGERLVRYFEPEGKGLYYLPYRFDGNGWEEFPQEVPRYNIRTEDGPHSQRDTRRWATGRLEFRPARPPRFDRVIVEMPSPYVIIDAEFSLGATLEAESKLSVETSTDGGKSWDEAGVLNGPHKGPWRCTPAVKKRSEHGTLNAVSGSYGYLVRFTLDGHGDYDDLLLLTRFQLNPRSLPALKPGANHLVFRPGEPRKRWVVPVTARRAREFAVRVTNARYVEEQGQGFWLPQSTAAAEFIFELSVPTGALTGFDAGGRYMHLRDSLAPDKLTAEVRKSFHAAASASEPEASLSWSTELEGEYKVLWWYENKPQWRDGVPIGRLFRWPEVDRQVRELPAGTRSIFLRYRIHGMALDDFRMASYGERGEHRGPLEIIHTWSENGERRNHRETVPDPGSARSYTIKTLPGAAISDESLTISLPTSSAALP